MKIKLKNRLEVLMKDSGVNTFEEMAQRLTEHQGVKIARTSLSRKFRDADVTLTLTMIEAICNELQCLPGDLFHTEVSDASEDFLDGLRTRLQPFRYGNILLAKGAASAKEESASTSREVPPAEAAPKAGKSADLTAITGPSVSHLHVGKLKKT